MAVITKIKPQRNGKRVNVYLDGKFAFGLDLENYMKLGLKVEQELSENEVEKIVKKAEYAKMANKLLSFVSLRPRSKREVELWFRRKKVNETLHKKLFNKLKRLDLQDDYKFAKWWVGQRLEFRNKSRRELIAELRVKGIDKNTIDDTLEEFDIDDTKSAKKLLDKKSYKWLSFDEGKRKQKMSEYLARKGFGWDTIKKALPY